MSSARSLVTQATGTPLTEELLKRLQSSQSSSFTTLIKKQKIERIQNLQKTLDDISLVLLRDIRLGLFILLFLKVSRHLMRFINVFDTKVETQNLLEEIDNIGKDVEKIPQIFMQMLQPAFINIQDLFIKIYGNTPTLKEVASYLDINLSIPDQYFYKRKLINTFKRMIDVLSSNDENNLMQLDLKTICDMLINNYYSARQSQQAMLITKYNKLIHNTSPQLHFLLKLTLSFLTTFVSNFIVESTITDQRLLNSYKYILRQKNSDAFTLSALQNENMTLVDYQLRKKIHHRSRFFSISLLLSVIMVITLNVYCPEEMYIFMPSLLFLAGFHLLRNTPVIATKVNNYIPTTVFKLVNTKTIEDHILRLQWMFNGITQGCHQESWQIRRTSYAAALNELVLRVKEYGSLSKRETGICFTTFLFKNNFEYEQDGTSIYLPVTRHDTIFKTDEIRKFNIHLLDILKRIENLFGLRKKLNELSSKFKVYTIPHEDKSGLPTVDFQISVSSEDHNIFTLDQLRGIFPGTNRVNEIKENGKTIFHISGLNYVEDKLSKIIKKIKAESFFQPASYSSGSSKMRPIPKGKGNKEDKRKSESKEPTPDKPMLPPILWHGKTYDVNDSECKLKPIRGRLATNRYLFFDLPKDIFPSGDDNYYNKFLELAKDPRIVPDVREQGFKFTSQPAKDFQTRENFMSCLKGKILGSKGKGNVRIFARSTTDDNNTVIIDEIRSIRYKSHGSSAKFIFSTI